MNKLALCCASITLCFSIALADASQHALLQVQWNQLEKQSNRLTDTEKFAKVQSITSLIDISHQASTHISRSTSDVFESGEASQAELAMTRWRMLSQLGMNNDQFRLIYLQHRGTSRPSVWLAQYDSKGITAMTSEKMLGSTDLEKVFEQHEVISVLDPNDILAARLGSRQSNGTSSTTYSL
jgi:hypothetical protein